VFDDIASDAAADGDDDLSNDAGSDSGLGFIIVTAAFRPVASIAHVSKYQINRSINQKFLIGSTNHATVIRRKLV